jgi:hypothetical protein
VSGGLFLAILLPQFDRWRLLTNSADCPHARVVIARLAGGKRSPGRALIEAAPAEAPPAHAQLRELLAAYQRMSAEQRERLISSPATARVKTGAKKRAATIS